MNHTHDKKLKILFTTYPMAFHTPGGGEMQLLAYRRHLEKIGVQVDLLDPWNPNFLDYDVIHFFSLVGGSVHFCNFIKQLGIPLVITSSLWITEETKHLYPMGEIKAQLSFADIIVGNSDIECDKMSEVLDIPRQNFSTVYNGVDEVFFDEISPDFFRKEINLNAPFVLNVGNLEPRKNQLKLVKAMKSFPEKKLILIGHLRNKEYAQEVFSEGGDQVVYLGYLEHGSELLRSAYAACDTFCLPSTLETPGLAALEAYTCNAHVSITNVGATEEYFKDHAAYCDPEDIESIVKSLVDTPKCIGDLNIYRWSDVAKDLLQVYEKLLNH